MFLLAQEPLEPVEILDTTNSSIGIYTPEYSNIYTDGYGEKYIRYDIYDSVLFRGIKYI